MSSPSLPSHAPSIRPRPETDRLIDCLHPDDIRQVLTVSYPFIPCQVAVPRPAYAADGASVSPVAADEPGRVPRRPP